MTEKCTVVAARVGMFTGEESYVPTHCEEVAVVRDGPIIRYCEKHARIFKA